MKLKSFAVAFAVMFSALTSAAVEFEVIERSWDLLPITSATPVTIPDLPSSRWGKWTFGDERPWFSYMLQPEAVGDCFEPPSMGYVKGDWQKFHAVWLRARRHVPAQWRGGHVFFVLSGIRCSQGRLFVNTKEMGSFGDGSCRIDVTSALRFGERNEFLMLLDGGDRAHYMLEKGPPELESRPAESVDDVYVNTSWREKRLTVEISVTTEKPKTVGVVAKVLDKDGKEVKVLRETYDVPAGTTVVKPSSDWTDPVTWELGRGYLYTLKTEVTIGAKACPCKDVRFGFRELWREGRDVILNGHEVNFRVTRDFGCNAGGAKMLTKLGFNTIDFRRDRKTGLRIDDELLEYLSANGIGVIAPVSFFDRDSAKGMASSESWSGEVCHDAERVIRRYRNWPCFVMQNFGTDVYRPEYRGDPAYFGGTDTSPVPKMIAEFAAAGRTVNSNSLYSSDSEGSLGDVESVNLVYDGAPIAEWEDRLGGWKEKGRVPFRIRELRLPRGNDWYRGGRDCVTEILAARYGDRAYELEPDTIRSCHLSNDVDCASHPLVAEFERDFVSRVCRAWRTFGVNCGIGWTDPEVGFGMPPPSSPVDGNAEDGEEKPSSEKKSAKERKPEMPKPVYDFLASDKDVPKAKPAWANGNWELAKSVNSGFLGWIAGSPRITDRRHAYEAGETVEKQCVMMWDGYKPRKLAVQWMVSVKKKILVDGLVEKGVVPGVPLFVPVSFKAPAVKRKTGYTLIAKFLNEKGKVIATDRFEFEVLPTSGDLPSDKSLNTAKTRVIAPFSLSSAADLPWDEIRNGLKVLVLQQSAEVMKSFGFEVDDIVPRRLFLRDRVSPALAGLDEDDLREWYGQARTEQSVSLGYEPFGHIVKAKDQTPRWNYNNALCGLLLHTPFTVGYLPVIEGGFDGDWSAVIRRYVGKGEIVFSMLSTTDRIGLNELNGAAVSDPSAKKTQAALYADLLQPSACPHNRRIYPSGAYALKLAKDYHADYDENGIVPSSVVLCGPDSEISVNEIVSAVRRGSNVLVIDNRRLAEGLGLKVGPMPSNGVYRVKFDPTNPDLASIGSNILHFRGRVAFAKIMEGGKDWRIDADGMFASRTYREGGRIFVSQLDPYRFENAVRSEFLNGGVDYYDDDSRKVKECKRALERVAFTIRHHRQFTARILTLLGIGSAD